MNSRPPKKTTSPSSTIIPLVALSNPEFISVEGADIHSRSKPDGLRFNLVSYNILAQVYVNLDWFSHSPPASLKFTHRSKSILKILKNLGADFFCLQEVDEFDWFYKGKMQEIGYSFVYMKRPFRKDGSAVFYKHDRVELILKERIEYNDLVTQLDGQKDVIAEKGPKFDRKVSNNMRLHRDCVGVLTAFKFKNTSNQFLIVANTHLYWDPKCADVKLAQAKYLLSRLLQFKTTVSDTYECIPEVILAGDFNSTPGDTVYQYLISGNSSSEMMPESCIEKAPIPLCSAYASVRGEPPFTNYTPGFTGTLDYIFFCPSDDIKPVSYLELPDSDAADIVGGLPNFSHPSDHLPIGAEFEIIKE